MALGWLWWRAWFPVDAVDAAAVCVAGVVLGTDIGSQLTPWTPPLLRGRRGGDMAVTLRGRRGTWRPWTSTLRGRRGTYWHWAGSGGALGSQLTPWTPPLFAWQAWPLATWTVTLRGRRGTWRPWTSTLRGRRGTW